MSGDTSGDTSGGMSSDMSGEMNYISGYIKIDFLAELLLASYLFLFLIKERKGKWRIGYPAVCAVVLPAVHMVIRRTVTASELPDRFWTQYGLIMLWFFAALLLTLLLNYALGKVAWRTALYVTFWAYLSEHIANGLYTTIAVAAAAYRQIAERGEVMQAAAFPVQVGSYLAAYGLAVFIFHRIRDNREEFELNMYQFMPMTVLLLGCGLGLNLYVKMRTFYQREQYDITLLLVSLIYDFLCAVFVIWVQIVAAKNQKLLVEIQVEQRLRERQKQHYRMSRDSIELINKKCHHLKHQIQKLREQKETGEWQDALGQLEQEIMIYNAIVKTGNDVVDVVVNEKSLLCEKEQITLTCLLDGRPLYVMDTMDVYELFSALLEAALKKAERQTEKEKKLIAVTQRQQGSFYYVQVECYGETDEKSGDGKDEIYLERIRRIAEKYEGSTDASYSGEIWMLRMMLRLKDGDGTQFGK